MITSLSRVISNDATNDIQLDVNVALRECVSRESRKNNECIICAVGTYSLDPESGGCEDCPDGAV